MARKDVSLVISARDKASTALDRVSASLEEFRVGQTEIEGQSGKTASALDKVAKAIGTVEKTFNGLDGASKLRSQLDSAAEAVERLRAESEENSVSLTEQSAKLRVAEKAVASYDAQLEKSVAAQAKQRKALKDAERAVRASAKAQESAEKSQAKLQARQAKLPALIAAQEASLVKVRGRYDELAQKMTEVAKVSPTLQKQFDASARNLSKNEDALTKLRAEYDGLSAAVEKSASALTGATGDTAKANSNLAKAKTRVEELAKAHARLSESARKAKVEQSGLEKELASTAQGGERVRAGLGQAEAALDELRVKTTATEAALKELSQVAFDQLGEQVVSQGIAFRQSQQDVADLTARVREYKQVIGETGVPTREMAQNLSLLEQAASEAELKMMRQEEALERMARAYRENGSSIEGAAKSQRVFAAEQERLSADLKELTEDGFRARRSIDALNAAQLKSAAGRMATDVRRLGNEAGRARPKISGLREAYNGLYGGSRQSLSITQRLRGEVLSMIAAYGGLYGVVNLLRQVTDAYQVLEAAQARLNVANTGNLVQTGRDLEYLRFQADRLGINLGTLSTEFSKFAIATQGTNLEGQRTRDIFQSVAEAARVARISNEQLSGIFTALTQIVSKGAVQMEELRQQLGDRLPGALQIMADGLGVTTGELIKMMEQGQVTADALIPFADELTRRFGPQLGEALGSTAAELGRLQNAAFNALLAFGNAGFLESFTGLVRDLIALLKSSDFQTFTERVSAVFSTLNNAAAFAVRNFRLVATVIGAAIGLKSVGIITAMVGALGNFTRSLGAVPARAAATTAAMQRMGLGANTLRGRLLLLQRGIQGLMGSTGVGLLLALGGAAFAGIATSASSANAALETQREILLKVTEAFDEADGSVSKFNDSLDDLTVTEARRSLAELERLARVARAELDQAFRSDGESGLSNFLGAGFITGASQAYNAEVEAIIQAYDDQALSAEELRREIDRVNEKYNDGSAANRRYADALDKATAGVAEANDPLRTARLLLQAVSGDAEESAAALEELANRGKETGRDLEAITTSGEDAGEALKEMQENADDLTGAIREMLREFPGLVDYLDQVEESEALAKVRREAIDAALEILDAKSAWEEFTGAIANFDSTGLLDILKGDLSEIQTLLGGITSSVGGLFSRLGDLGGVLNEAVGGIGNFMANAVAGSELVGSALEQSAQLIRESEGFRETPYWDVNAYRAGYGSDTFMRNGQTQTVTPESRVTRAEAEADLNRRLTEFQNVIIGQIGQEVFRAMSANQQAALTSIAYNYGSLPGRVTGPINAGGDDQAIANAILSLQGDNEGINRQRRSREAAIFLTTSDPEGAEARVIEAAQPAVEQEQALEQGRQELEIQRLINEGREREAEILQARNEALRQNPSIDAGQLAEVERQAAAQFDLNAARDAGNEAERESQRLAEEAAAQQAGTEDTLDNAEFEIRQQELRNQGLERQALIEAAIRDAKANDPNITQQEIALLSARTSALYDAQRASAGVTDELEAAEAAQERVNELTEQRTALQEQLEATIAAGDVEGAMALRGEIEGVNAELLSAITNAESLWEAVGGTAAETAIAQLGTARLEAEGLGDDAENTYLKWDSLADLFVNGLAGAVDRFSKAVANGEDRLTAARDAIRQFAGEFLIQIAQMILKQLTFNALTAVFGGTAFGATIGVGVGTGHSGGRVGSKRVGSGNSVKTVNPAIFASAHRYHGGGMIGGLGPGEVPIIAKEGEYMAAEDDPLHPNNQKSSGGAAAPSDMTIYNLVDGEQVMRAALNADKGGSLLLNHIRANKDSFKAILNG